MREARARIVTMTIHKLVLGTGYSSTSLVAGTLHVQLQIDDAIGLFVDNVMTMAYNVWVQIITTRTVRGRYCGYWVSLLQPDPQEEEEHEEIYFYKYCTHTTSTCIKFFSLICSLFPRSTTWSGGHTANYLYNLQNIVVPREQSLAPTISSDIILPHPQTKW